MQGVLLDQGSVIAAKNLIEAEGASKRCELVAGDFFESVPSGGDAYILKYILHDWDNERASRTLSPSSAISTETRYIWGSWRHFVIRNF